MRARLAAKVLNAAADGRKVNRRTLAGAERRLGLRMFQMPRVAARLGGALRASIEISATLVEAVVACVEALSGMASAWGTMAREATRAAHATGCADRGDAFVRTPTPPSWLEQEPDYPLDTKMG